MQDEYVKDRLCPECSSRLKLSRRAGIVYCSSMSCKFVEEGFKEFVPASELLDDTSRFAVTGRGLGGSGAVANFAGRPASASPPAPVIMKQTGGSEMGEYEEIEKELEYRTMRGEKWTPEPGNQLIGEVTKKDEPIVGKNKDGSDKKNQLIVVKDGDGKLWTVWKSKALEELFGRVKVGDTVGLKFIGKQGIKTGGTFKKIEYVLKPVA